MKPFSLFFLIYLLFCKAEETISIQKRLDSLVTRVAFEELSLNEVLKIKKHPLLSQDLLQAIQKVERKLVKINCRGKYTEGMICGLDYNPISCSQDIPLYEYTLKKSDPQTIIFQAGENAMYYWRKKNKDWQLDGIACTLEKEPELWMFRFNVK